MLGSRIGDSTRIGMLTAVAFGMLCSPTGFAAPGDGRPTVLVNPHVRGNGTASTIQEGINKVGAGGKVLVLPGRYPEALIINKGLTLESVGGESGPVIVAPPAGSIVAIDVTGTAPVTIRGIQIEHSGLHGIRGMGAVHLTVEHSSVVGALGATGRGVLVLNDARASGSRARMVVRDSDFDLLQRPLTPDGAPQFQNFGIDAAGDVDGLIERNVVRRAGGACIFIRTLNTFMGETNVDIVGNDLDECYPTGRAGAVLVGPVGALQPASAVSATGTINIIGNIIRNSFASCRVATGINFEMYGGRIEHNVIVDVVPQCATASVRNLQGGIWVGSLLSHRGPVRLPPATPVIRFNDISGNAHAGLRVSPDQAVPVQATCNWWGAATGPSGGGSGAGDAVLGAATFTPWAMGPFAGTDQALCSEG
jgi:Right handed beta helix region